MKNQSKKFLTLCKKYEVDPNEVNEVMSVPDAFKQRKLDIKLMPVVSKLPKRFRLWLEWLYRMAVVIEALNLDENGKAWIPDYTDTNQYKYYIWWKVKADSKHKSGSGLAYDDYGRWRTNATVPARLCFRTRGAAIFFAKHFHKEHKNVQLFLE